jgi:hypothetical protein
MTLERIDTNGNYEPSNCVWADKKAQGKNRRTSYYWDVFGIRYESSYEAAAALGVSEGTVRRWCGKSAGSAPRSGCCFEPRYPDEKSLLVPSPAFERAYAETYGGGA